MDIKPEVAQAIVRVLVKSAEQADQVDAQVKAATDTAKRVPGVVDTLVKAGYLTNDQRPRATETLKNPGKALETLQRIALIKGAAQGEGQPAGMGESSTPDKDARSTEKRASHPSSQSAADRHFLSSFGLQGG
jgi:hypothetical protein